MHTKASSTAYGWISWTDKHTIVIGVGNAVLQWATELLTNIGVRQSEIMIDRANGRDNFRSNFVSFLL